MISERRLDCPHALPGELHKWFTNVMNFEKHGKCPTSEKIGRLCVGQNKEIWQYIMEHIRPKRDVKKIRGNLLLSSNQFKIRAYDSDGGPDDSGIAVHLLKRAAMLEEKLAKEEDELQSLENDLNRVEGDLLTNEMKNRDQLCALFSEECVRIVSEKVKNKVKREDAKVEEMAHMINRRSNELDHPTRKSCKVSTALVSKCNLDKPRSGLFEAMDTKCFAEVEQACVKIENYLKQSLLNDIGENRNIDRTTDIEAILRLAKEVRTKYSANQINFSLVKTINQSDHQLWKTLKNLDESKCIAQHATLTEQFNLLHKDTRIKLIEQFSAKEKFVNTSSAVQLQNSEREEFIHDHIMGKYSGDLKLLLIAQSLYKIMRQVIVARTVYSSLEEHSKQLKKKYWRAEKDRDELNRRHSQLIDLNKTLKENRELICSLMCRTLELRSGISFQQNKVIQYVSKDILSNKDKWIAIVQNFKKFVSKESEIYIRLDPQYLWLTFNNSQKIIHSLLSNHIWPFQSEIWMMIHALNFPRYQSLDELLLHVFPMVTIINPSQFKSPQLESNGFQNMINIIESLKDLKVKVAKEEEVHVEQNTWMLCKRVSYASQMLDFHSQMEAVIFDWWNQPAQFLLSWVQVDGLNFQEWFDSWKVAVSVLHHNTLTGF